MCCLFTILVLLGPRVLLAFWWLVDQTRFNLVFNTWFWPLLGIIFVPWATLMYLLVWQFFGGVDGWGWVWVGLGLLADIASYAGGGYRNRNRIPGYPGSTGV
jgi:hypothetical protein